MQIYKYLILLLFFVTATTPSVALSGELISYQGVLTDTNGVVVADDSYSVQFSLFPDSLGGSAIWTETAIVSTQNGIFQHNIGSTTNLSANLFKNRPALFLELSINTEIMGKRTRLSSVPYALVSQTLCLRGGNNQVIAEVFGNDAGKLRLADSSQKNIVELNTAMTSDLSVQLPDSAINSDEIVDEPGVVVRSNSTIVDLSTGSMSDLVTLSIEIPRDGYITLHGKCYLLLSGTTSANSAQIQINETEGGVPEFPYYTQAGLGGYVNTAVNYFPIYVTRTYFKKAGIWEFRMEGRAMNNPPAVAQSWDHILTAVYYPTDYYYFGRSGKSEFERKIDSAGTVR